MFNTINNSKKWALACIILIAVLLTGIIYAMQGDSPSKKIGRKQAEAISNAGDEIVATLDGDVITKKGFDTYKLMVNSGPTKLSDKEILDKIINRQIEYNQALKEGYAATDDELDNFTRSQQEAVKYSQESYDNFKDYVSGMNMTEEQYWESVRPVYKKVIICGKFKNALKQKFVVERNITDRAELNKKFQEYYEQYIKDLKSKVKIKSYLK